VAAAALAAVAAAAAHLQQHVADQGQSRRLNWRLSVLLLR
jgi:hypothetical protein